VASQLFQVPYDRLFRFRDSRGRLDIRELLGERFTLQPSKVSQFYHLR
jgi:hypothetical protein